MFRSTVLLKDADIPKEFDNDTNAKVLYHHQISEIFCFLDKSQHISSEIINLYRQGLYLHHYKFLDNKRIVVFVPKIVPHDKIARVDPMAFNYGYIVNGMAYAFKQKCIVCSKDTSNLCGRCKVVFYCGKDCQRADFSGHKGMCKMVHEDREMFGRTFEENKN
jgi:hypothetical protein